MIRDYYLNEQMKAIQKELGESEDGVDEFEQLEQKIEAAQMPDEARDKTKAELQKLQYWARKSQAVLSAKQLCVLNT